MFTSRADNTVRVVADAMAQVKQMQDSPAEHLNVKTDVLKQESDLLENSS